MVQMLFGNMPFEACFKLRSNSKTFYIKTRITSGPATGAAYGKNAQTGKTIHLRGSKKVWALLVP